MCKSRFKAVFYFSQAIVDKFMFFTKKKGRKKDRKKKIKISEKYVKESQNKLCIPIRRNSFFLKNTEQHEWADTKHGIN